MRISSFLGRTFLACIAGFGLGAMLNASAADASSDVLLAQNEYYDDPQPRRRTGPTRAEVRGHENDIQVTRRRATPIPQVTRSRPKPRVKQGRPGYNSSYYGPGGYGGHGYYYSGHIHYSHCGHYGYGDDFDSRTLGRSCMYGPKGEVIYKPADVICAPEDGAEPAAEPAARRPAPTPAAPAAQPSRAPAEPQARQEAPREPAPDARRAPVRSAR